jgi:hypothetical protein
MNYREAILTGVKAASALHKTLDTRSPVEIKQRGNIDVFGSILNLNKSLLFRPLDGLLGACVNGAGVIISTNRPLSVQRFTGAHELGHVFMEHVLSLDGDEILGGELSPNSDAIEIEANAFAAEFLLPRWLLTLHAKWQGWNAQSMTQPLQVYQLSLRAGASYEATVRSLEKHKIINYHCCQELLRTPPKTIKQSLLPGYSPENWYRDVWLITKHDEGASLEGQPEDLFLFQLSEKTGAGYLWDFETAKQKGFIFLCDKRTAKPNSEVVGADVIRSLALHSPRTQKGDIVFKLARPWEADSPPIEQLNIRYNLLGKEIGLPRAMRPELAVAA